MLSRLRRFWPLVSRAYCDRLVADLLDRHADELGRLAERMREAERARRLADERADKADARAARMQEAFCERARSFSIWGPEWDDLVGRAIENVRDRRCVRAVFSPVEVEVEARGPSLGSAFKVEDVRLELLLVSARVGVGLTKDCPPELVADELARRVRAAVLSQWRDQSILLN